jgi:hypothetical protein
MKLEVKNMLIRSVAVALTAFSGAVNAQGYFDFAQVPGLGDEPTVQIDLNPAMLGFVIAAAQETDPTVAETIRGIENVRVRVYEHIEDSDAVLAFVDDSSGQLERDGWQRMVYIQEDDEKVRIYVKIEETRPVGLTVMVVDGSGDEAVFINVAGDIDPVKLGQAANSVGIGGIFDGIIGAHDTADDAED